MEILSDGGASGGGYVDYFHDAYVLCSFYACFLKFFKVCKWIWVLSILLVCTTNIILISLIHYSLCNKSWSQIALVYWFSAFLSCLDFAVKFHINYFPIELKLYLIEQNELFSDIFWKIALKSCYYQGILVSSKLVC